MKLGHFWPTLRHSPLFVLRHGASMVAHTFRGSSLRSMLGLESERDVFHRYRKIRRAERDYLPTIPAIASHDAQRAMSGVRPEAPST